MDKTKNRLTMEKTKFIRVAVEERLPKKGGSVFSDIGQIFFNNKSKKFEDRDYSDLVYPKWWLLEIPDREDEMLQMLERVTSAFYGEELELYQFNRIEEAKKLIQSVKQTK